MLFKQLKNSGMLDVWRPFSHAQMGGGSVRSARGSRRPVSRGGLSLQAWAEDGAVLAPLVTSSVITKTIPHL